MLFKLFYSTLAGYTQTNCAGNSTNTSVYNSAETQLHQTLAHMHTHCVFNRCLLLTGLPRRCQVWHHHPAPVGAPRSILPPPHTHPTQSSPSPFRCCMSVNQCNLWFHVRLGSNDHNNNDNNNDNGNNIYNNNLLLCVCTVPGWCSVQFSLSLKRRERGSRMHILQLV